MENTQSVQIFLAADHGGWQRKNVIREFLTSQNYSITDLVPDLDAEDDYPKIAKKMADSIEEYGKTHPQNTCFGIALCGTGQGMCMALNRFLPIRAGVTTNPEIATLLRQHNQANVLCLPGRFSSDDEIFNCITAFLNSKINTETRHQRRVNELSSLI